MSMKQMTRTWIDSLALYDAIDDERAKYGWSWRMVARELGIAPSFFTRLKNGLVPDMKNVCLVCDWLDAKIDDFRAPDGERLPRRPRIPVEELAPVMSPEQIDEINRAVFDSENPEHHEVVAAS